jgi:hypothetical protein
MRHFTTSIPSLNTEVRTVSGESNAAKARRATADFMREHMGGTRPFHIKEEKGERNPAFTAKLEDVARLVA